MSAQGGTSAPLPPFLEEALAELVQHDSLLVLAKGLGMHAVLRRLVLQCLGPAHLVLLLNTTLEEEELLLHELRRAGVDDALLPPTINNEWSAAQRIERYLRGGVLLVTARILVVDMLCERLPTGCVDGVLVANAHRVSESSNVAFALRMFRQRRRTGFVRALSDEPGAIMRGFGRVERVRGRLPENRPEWEGGGERQKSTQGFGREGARARAPPRGIGEGWGRDRESMIYPESS